jgi:hypothetical protein
MRKSLWMIAVVMLFTALGSTAARADTVVYNGGGWVTAIDGITLNGTLYNVTFTNNIDNTFAAYAADSSTINGILGALDADLGSTLLNDDTGYFYAVSAAAGQSGVAEFQCPVTHECWNNLDPILTEDFTFIMSTRPTIDFWANFSPSTVAIPEPSAFMQTLTGVGLLGLMMMKRRRVALRHPQAT